MVTPEKMTLESAVVLLLVLLFFVSGWYGLMYVLSPHMADPDGMAKIAGNCGDTMEIGLRIKDGRVEKTHHWTDGCTMSRTCVESAARLAQNQTPESLRSITMIDIIEDVGAIPDTHLHCAQLAETTLQRALDDYFAGKAVRNS